LPLGREPTYRSIEKTERFERELASIHDDIRRCDEFVTNAEFLLSVNPYAGFQLIPSHVWFLPIAEALGRARNVLHLQRRKGVVTLHTPA
jgi:hypothetical protein